MSIDAKALFDAIRDHTGPLSTELVEAVNAVLQADGPAASHSVPSMMIRHLRREEGVIPHAYQDHLGFWTIGVGRLIDKRKGGRLTDAEIDILLANDITRLIKAMEVWPSWERVKDDPARATALLSMCFQMGPVGLAKFKTTLSLIASGDFKGAAQSMLASLWAKQTPERAKRVATMLRTGAEA
jgi:lysozyme